jgi:hypothetical protein
MEMRSLESSPQPWRCFRRCLKNFSADIRPRGKLVGSTHATEIWFNRPLAESQGNDRLRFPGSPPPFEIDVHKCSTFVEDCRTRRSATGDAETIGCGQHEVDVYRNPTPQGCSGREAVSKWKIACQRSPIRCPSCANTNFAGGYGGTDARIGHSSSYRMSIFRNPELTQLERGISMRR